MWLYALFRVWVHNYFILYSRLRNLNVFNVFDVTVIYWTGHIEKWKYIFVQTLFIYYSYSTNCIHIRLMVCLLWWCCVAVSRINKMQVDLIAFVLHRKSNSKDSGHFAREGKGFEEGAGKSYCFLGGDFWWHSLFTCCGT